METYISSVDIEAIELLRDEVYEKVPAELIPRNIIEFKMSDKYILDIEFGIGSLHQLVTLEIKEEHTKKIIKDLVNGSEDRSTFLSKLDDLNYDSKKYQNTLMNGMLNEMTNLSGFSFQI